MSLRRPGGHEAPDDAYGVDWVDVCGAGELVMDRGVAALVGGEQIALFRLSPGDTVFAIANRDPFSGANVLGRGIVGSIGEVPTVASPMYKQRFDLRSGRCMDDDGVAVVSFAVRILDGRVQVSLR